MHSYNNRAFKLKFPTVKLCPVLVTFNPFIKIDVISSYYQILIFGVHLCLILFYIKCPLQKTIWTLCLKKIREHWEEGINLHILQKTRFIFMPNFCLLNLHQSLSACGSKNFKRGLGLKVGCWCDEYSLCKCI